MPKKKLNITTEKIIEFLSQTDLFTNMTTNALREIAKGFSVEYVAGRKILFSQADNPSCLYVLMYGLLCAIKEYDDGTSKKIGEIRPGSVVGEIGCLFDVARTASVYAIRDSVLLKMTKKTFSTLLKVHPNIMLGIAKESVQRLVNPKKTSFRQGSFSFTLIPAGKYSDIEEFSQIFAKKLSKYGNVLLLTRPIFKKLYGNMVDKISMQNTQVLSCIHELETKYKFLVYIAPERNNWSDICLRQADKILLIGNYGEDPTLNDIEATIFTRDSDSDVKPTIDLLLLFADIPQFVNVTPWLNKRRLSEHHKVRVNRTEDLERFVRLITGNSLGLVLSGGGSLALAHVGVYKALQEANITVDYVSGSSMGGLVAALIAMEVDYKTMTEMLEKQLISFQKNVDYTFPIIALIRAKLLDKLLQESFGKNLLIENLWQKYFCVSTNISINKVNVHDSGILWKAIRASLSLPGILPVVFNDKKQILVDGSIINNLPVDIMQGKINNGKILASAVRNREMQPMTLSYQEYTSSGLSLFYKYFLLPKFKKTHVNKKIKLLNIASIVQSSMIIGSNNHQQKMLEQADFSVELDVRKFSMINFYPIHKIINAGYKQAIVALENS